MEGKHVFAGWVAGALLSNGIWLSISYPVPYTLIPTILFGIATIFCGIVWILVDV